MLTEWCEDLELRNILQEKAIVPKNVYRACGIFAFISFDTIAFTYTHGETEEEIDNTPGQITICPWYIRMLKLKSTLNKWIDTVDIINALAPRLQGSWSVALPKLRMLLGIFAVIGVS